ncbi:MAG: hypothetical protein WGN25_16860 [Candidatus Electrothrix sp. GW3-4]|uniref:hypothetical protein n=1 Tax=Candidatus Electrothrix sp. GW3-4 TaxID=3126740 RepID=UPI0030CF4FAF
MSETRRLPLRCYNSDCNRIYELTLELEGQPRLRVQCPYCGTSGTVTLNRYRIIRDNTITRSGGEEKSSTEGWSFPSPVPVEAEE